MLLSSTVNSSLGSNKSAIAGHSNSMTKKAYVTFVLSLPEIAFQLRVSVGPLSPSANYKSTNFCILRENEHVCTAVRMASSHVARS